MVLLLGSNTMPRRRTYTRSVSASTRNGPRRTSRVSGSPSRWFGGVRDRGGPAAPVVRARQRRDRRRPRQRCRVADGRGRFAGVTACSSSGSWAGRAHRWSASGVMRHAPLGPSRGAPRGALARSPCGRWRGGSRRGGPQCRCVHRPRPACARLGRCQHITQHAAISYLVGPTYNGSLM